MRAAYDQQRMHYNSHHAWVSIADHLKQVGKEPNLTLNMHNAQTANAE